MKAKDNQYNGLKFFYKNDQYAEVARKSLAQLTTELKKVFKTYEEYHNNEHEDNGFLAMVTLFAKDDFFHYHYVAKAYLLTRIHRPYAHELPDYKISAKRCLRYLKHLDDNGPCSMKDTRTLFVDDYEQNQYESFLLDKKLIRMADGNSKIMWERNPNYQPGQTQYWLDLVYKYPDL